VALVGASGSGKSTFLLLLAGLLEPDGGTIRYNSCDGSEPTPKVALVPQETFLFDLSVEENLRLVRPEATAKEIQLACELAVLEDIPLSVPVGNRGDRLSGGQRQRVAIARAILYQPAVLLLDEATSALDPELEFRILSNLAKLETTLVFATHRLNVVRDFDLICVFDNGEIIAQGSHDELMRIPAYRRQMSTVTG